MNNTTTTTTTTTTNAAREAGRLSYREQLVREAAALDNECARLRAQADMLPPADAHELRRLAGRLGSAAEEAKLKLALLPECSAEALDHLWAIRREDEQQ